MGSPSVTRFLAAHSLPAGDLPVSRIERAVGEGQAELIVFPEAALPGYRHARAQQGRLARELALELAQQHRRHVALGFLEGTTNGLGLASPDGQWHLYQKQHPAPAEARHWLPGKTAGIVQTRMGRVGLLICADLLQLGAWEALRGQVDLVAIAAAWPTYAGRRAPPGFTWVQEESAAYRDGLIGRAAASLGVAVVLADASGPGFVGESAIWNGRGERVASGSRVEAMVSGGSGGPPLHHQGRWRWFAPLYAKLGKLRGLRYDPSVVAIQPASSSQGAS